MNVLLNSRNDHFFETIDYIKGSSPSELESIEGLVRLQGIISGAIELKFLSTAKARGEFKKQVMRVFRGDHLDDFRVVALAYFEKKVESLFDRRCFAFI